VQLEHVRSIIQIEGPASTGKVNAYLNHGWEILAITQRGENSVSEGGTSHLIVVFVMGNHSDKPTHPKQDMYSKAWS